MTKTTSINLRISPEFRADIEALAAYHGLTLSSYAHSLLVKAVRKERAEVFHGVVIQDTEFDLANALNRSDDPSEIMGQWFRFEGRELPADYGIQMFQGWETYTRDEKEDAMRDAKSVLDRILKSMPATGNRKSRKKV